MNETTAEAPEFKKYAREKNNALLIELNNWLAPHDRDNNPDSGGNGQMLAGVGVFYFDQDMEDDPRREL